MSYLDDIRRAIPELRNLDDSDLIGEFSKVTGVPFADVADTFKAPTRGAVSEVVRQGGAGLMVELPRMVGQGAKYLSEPGGALYEAGQGLVRGAEERAPGWQYDPRGRGLVGETFAKGARAIGPMVPALAAGLVPGGQFAAPAVAAGLFGTSSAQDTYEKILEQTGDEEAALAAARRAGAIQGVGGAAGTFVAGRFLSAAKPLFGIGAKTTGGVAERLTDTAILKPLAKAYAGTVAAETATEVGQDVSTELVERAYGAKPEDILGIAKESAQGAIGLTSLLGPLALGGHVQRARRAEVLKDALYGQDIPEQVRAKAIDVVLSEAAKQKIAPADIDNWFNEQLTIEDERTARLAAAAGEAETYAQTQRTQGLVKTVAEEGLIAEQDLMTPGRTNAAVIDQVMGIDRKGAGAGYPKVFEAAFNEPSGIRVSDPETGIERELSVGERIYRDAGITPQNEAPAEGTKPTASKSKVFNESEQALIDRGVKPSNKAIDLLTEAQNSGLDLSGSDLTGFWTLMSESKFKRAKSALASAVITSKAANGKTIVAAPAVATAGKPAVTAAAAPVVAAQPAVTAAQPAAETGVGTGVRVAPAQPATQPATVTPIDLTQGAPSVAQATQTVQAEPQGQEAAAAPAAGLERVVQRRRVVTPTAPAAGFVAPETTVAEAPVAAPELSLEDLAEIEATVGGTGGWQISKASTANGGQAQTSGLAQAMLQEQEGQRVDGGDIESILPKLMEVRFAKSKDPARDAEIAMAYLNAVRDMPRTGKIVQLQDAIGKRYGVGAQMVRKVGNIAELARSGKALGYTEEEIYRMLETRKTSKAAAGEAVKAEAAGGSDITGAMQEAGIEAAEGETLGFGFDDADTWKQSVSGMGDTANAVAEAKANAIQSILDKQDKLRDSIESMADLGMDTAVAELEDQIAALDGQLTRAMDAYKRYLEGGTKDAVQIESPAGVPVQSKAEAGEGVGRQVRRAKKPAGEGKAPTKILTNKEQAAQAWDEVATDFPDAPKFADLTKAQQESFVEFGPDNWTKDDVETALVKLARGEMKFGKETVTESKTYTAKQLMDEIKSFMRADIPGRKLMVVETVDDLLKNPDPDVRAVGAGIRLAGAFGVAANGRAYLVADRIRQGSGRAKFMHEVGSHLGLDNLLTKADQDKLINQIKNWVRNANGSLESEIALRAMEQVVAAGTPKQDQRSEVIAYFVQYAMEMGVDPTAAEDSKLSGPLRSWFRTLWAAFKAAVRKLGVKPESLTAQDVVNLAYGAARLEINGTWHGTAAAFRNFRNKYIGSGEGATAYGWGTYLAQRTGIAKGYWEADVARKAGVNPDAPSYRIGGKVYTYSDAASDQEYVEYIAAEWLASGKTAAELTALASEEEALRNSMTAKAINLAVQWALEGKVARRDTNNIEGSLMRVDIALEGDRVFDYDKPIIKQSNYVANKLMELLDPVADEVVERTNKDIEELTGGDLFGSGENNLGLISSLIMDDAISPAKPDAAFDKAVAQGKYHEAASHYMRILGIDGIKFFDARSRGTGTTAIAFGGKRYDREELREQSKKASAADDQEKSFQFMLLRDILRSGFDVVLAESKAKVAAMEQMYFATSMQSAARFGVDVDRDQEMAAAKARVQRDDFHAARVRWLEANEKNIAIVENPRTQNLVVFDDKNIFRVGAQTAADRQRMKFGKDEGAINRGIDRLPKAAQQPARSTLASIGDWTRKGIDRAVFTGDLVNRAVEAGLTVAKSFERLLASRGTKAREMERDVERIADMYALVPEKDRGTGLNSVNQFLFDSTREGKWGYGKYRAEDMGARFDALDEKSKAFVRAVFAHGDKMLALKKKTVLDFTASEYDARISQAEKDGDTNTAANLRKEKANDLKKFEALFKLREGIPYAPIKRMGSHVVVAKSPQYREAEANKDQAALRRLEKDADHYHVSFVESKNEARVLADQLREQGFFGRDGDAVDFFEREKYQGELFGGSSMLAAITKLRAMTDAKANEEERGAAQLQRMVSDLYLQTLAENSARKSEMRRRGVAGEVDMLRSFTAQGRADAQFLSSVQFNQPIQDAIQSMRNQVKVGGNRDRKSELFNELSARYLQSLESVNTPLLNKLTRLTSIWFLATSPAYYLQNLSQPWMMSVPAMAGRHDYTKASAELFKAYSQLGGVMKSAKLFRQQFDFAAVPADVRNVIKKLADRGKIDIGLESEIGEFRVEGEGPITDRWNKIDKGMRLAVQKVESINRLSTAMAAYRLEMAKSGNAEAALDYADRILTETHGDYTRFNAPRVFNTQLGKVALQFRKFQLVQLSFYAKLIKDAFTGKDRAAALKALTYSLGHTALLAGVMGLPGYAAISYAIGALFGDDDEPFDTTAELRKLIGDEDVANLIMRGAPTLAGADISGKVGAGTMLSLMPFSDADLTKPAGMAEALGTAVGGASLGLATRFVDGMGLMLGGDLYKGMERLLPKGLSDAAKAVRQSQEGMTRRNNDIILPPEEVSAVDTLLQAIGVQPVKQSVTYEKRDVARSTDQAFQDRATRLKNNYSKAVRQNDTEAAAKAREDWRSLQEARRRTGYKVQPLSELLKAPREQLKRERNTVGGVQFNKNNRQFAQEQV